MPRNASGVYTLPPTNPVVPFTTIATSWANPTMSDIATALTDSLDRNGRGGMLAPFKIYDGTVSAPGLGFLNEPNLGIYRSASGIMSFVTGGAAVLNIGVGIVTAPATTKSAIYGEQQYRQVGQKWWRAKNVDGALTFTPSLTADAEDWDPTKAVTFTPSGGGSSYVLKAGDTMTGGLTLPVLVTNAGGVGIALTKTNDAGQANYLVGRNQSGLDMYQIGAVDVNSNDLTVRAARTNANTIVSSASGISALTLSGTGSGTAHFNTDIVVQKAATPSIGAIVLGNAGANIYYDGSLLTFNAMSGIAVTGVSGYVSANTVQYTRASPVPRVTQIDGTYSANWLDGLSQVLSLGSATVVTPINIPNGGILRLILTNTAAGLTFSGVQWPGGTTPTFTTGPLKVAIVVLSSGSGVNYGTYTVF